MKKGSNWLRELSVHGGMYDEPLPWMPLTEIAGDQRILLEHHDGVLEYGSECIRVRVRFGSICITGSQLELTRMRSSQLVITGRICCIQLERGKNA